MGWPGRRQQHDQQKQQQERKNESSDSQGHSATANDIQAAGDLLDSYHDHKAFLDVKQAASTRWLHGSHS
jgi:hypothetical protein